MTNAAAFPLPECAAFISSSCMFINCTLSLVLTSTMFDRRCRFIIIVVCVYVILYVVSCECVCGMGPHFVHLSSSSCRTLSPSLSFHSRSSRLAVVKHKQYPTVSDVPLLLFPPDSGSCKAHGNCLLSSQTPRFSNLIEICWWKDSEK